MMEERMPRARRRREQKRQPRRPRLGPSAPMHPNLHHGMWLCTVPVPSSCRSLPVPRLPPTGTPGAQLQQVEGMGFHCNDTALIILCPLPLMKKICSKPSRGIVLASFSFYPSLSAPVTGRPPFSHHYNAYRATISHFRRGKIKMRLFTLLSKTFTR